MRRNSQSKTWFTVQQYKLARLETVYGSLPGVSFVVNHLVKHT